MGASDSDHYAITIGNAQFGNGGNIGGIGLRHLAQDTVIAVYNRFIYIDTDNYGIVGHEFASYGAAKAS